MLKSSHHHSLSESLAARRFEKDGFLKAFPSRSSWNSLKVISGFAKLMSLTLLVHASYIASNQLLYATGKFTCGQHYPKNRELNLTIADFGVGIPSNVRLFHGKQFRPEQLSASSCIQWAFQSGTSTKLGSRGIGLDLLQAFVRKNRGRLEIFSHEGYALVTENGVSFGDRQTFFEGTLVNISLRCDEKYYCLTSELTFEPPF